MFCLLNNKFYRRLGPDSKVWRIRLKLSKVKRKQTRKNQAQRTKFRKSQVQIESLPEKPGSETAKRQQSSEQPR